MRAMPTSSPYAMVSVDEACAAILVRAAPLGTERVSILVAAGRVLAADVIADGPLPPGPRSAVDGYAVRAADRGDRALLGEELIAGPEHSIDVGAGQAVRIMTGAPMPTGADAVVMVEDTAESDRHVQIHLEATLGSNVHRPGLDIETGQLVVEAGAVIGPSEIGLLATIGVADVPVYRRPRVAILATGDELVEPWETPPPGCIRDSNRYALMAAVSEAGADVAWQGIARDRDDDLTSKVQNALAAADVLITSGGVSMGTRDLIKPLLEHLGTVHFGRVNFKPGKPLTFATVGDKRVFGLPGFPVSSLVTFEVFVRAAILTMAGRRDVRRPRIEVELDHELRPDPSRPEYHRAVVGWRDGRLTARSTGAQGSSRLLSMRGANALLVLRASDQVLPAGTRVTALLTGALQ